MDRCSAFDCIAPASPPRCVAFRSVVWPRANVTIRRWDFGRIHHKQNGPCVMIGSAQREEAWAASGGAQNGHKSLRLGGVLGMQEGEKHAAQTNTQTNIEAKKEAPAYCYAAVSWPRFLWTPHCPREPRRNGPHERQSS